MNTQAILLILILFTALGAQANEFPVECIRHSLNESFSSIAIGETSRYFVKCASTQAAPQPYQVRPRYSESEIKELHQSFVAVTDCLEVDPQLIFPRLMMESGFHVQIQSPGGDAGIGQLTSKAIIDVNANLPGFKKLIFSSKKPSCRWIQNQSKNHSQFWQPVTGKSKCALMARPENPLKNLLYTVIFQRLNQLYVDHEFEAKNMADLLHENGYPESDYATLKRILVALGYNTGGAVAVGNLQDYLLSRLDFTQRKKLEFNVDPKTLARVSPADFDFTMGLKKFDDRKAALKADLLQKYPKLSDQEIESSVQRSLRNISASQYSFPEWLKVWQSHGGPGYVSGLVGLSLRLDQKFGAGVCSDANEYQLWGD